MQAHYCSPAEEKFNTITHALGVVASAALLPYLLRAAAEQGDVLSVIGALIFGITLVSAYGASTVYHAVAPGPKKELWLRVDYAAIYLLIAGTYTPFMLGALRGSFGTTLLVVVWAGALLGIVVKLRLGPRYPAFSRIAYLTLGWLAVVALKPMLAVMGWEGIMCVVAGGLAYSAGLIFLACERKLKFGHCAWHIFVLGGSACHVIAVSAYGLRAP